MGSKSIAFSSLVSWGDSDEQLFLGPWEAYDCSSYGGATLITRQGSGVAGDNMAASYTMG